MAYKTFRDKVTKHLAKYNRWGYGSFNGKGSYGHIPSLEGHSKSALIREIMLADGLPEEQLDLFRSPHRYAHHLNSSQILCYEFFRPRIGSDGMVDGSLMLPVLEAAGIPSAVFIGAHAEFEKVFDDGEGTNFDFYLESPDGKGHVFVEVKYTEQGFGTCEKGDSHEKKFEEVYKDRIRTCPCLKEDLRERICFEEMRPNYQLFRNILRVRGENDYVVFIYPEENTIAEYQFDSFRKKYVDPSMHSHVLGLHWEDLKGIMADRVREKFFEY